MKNKFLYFAALIGGTYPIVSEAQVENPNIIFILADDMGYGDISSLNKESKICTPNLDQMVREGVSFSDAHTSSSVSTPTRYGILTGRYNWRSKLKRGVLNGYSEPLITKDRITIASLLKRKGYTTACIGKWHLGWDWTFKNKNNNEVDFEKPIKNGPTSVGFDYFYGFCGSLDMPPYVYVENEHITALPDRETVNTGMGFWRKGPTGKNFVHENTLSHITDLAINYIRNNSQKNQPFFLYLPLPAPHTPILPTKDWKGKSGLNPYGDFVMMVDYEVGRVLNVINELGIDENTLIVYTSDNGCSPQARYEELLSKGHNPSFIYRGHKADLFEGGHRVPCIVKWKGKLCPTIQNETICLTDFFATFAEITGVKLQDNEGEDSFSMCPLLMDNSKEYTRKSTIHHSITGEFAIRKGKWKLLVSPSSGGWSVPKPNSKEASVLPPIQLYNLENDPSEQNNLFNQHPDIVKELLSLLRKQIREGRSTPGKTLSNDMEGEWNQLDYVFKDFAL
ncbi:MAG: arylsulfatase [Parabacteroides sp.]|nr:arylsulfatase [Parabacteroides sp.]